MPKIGSTIGSPIGNNDWLFAGGIGAPIGGSDNSGTPALPVQLGAFGWYDASDTSPTNIVHVANAVSQFSDKSGNARHLTQATGFAKPTTNTRTLNGQNVLDFNSNDRLDAPASFNALPNGDNTILMVVKFDGIGLPNDQTLMSKAGGGGQFNIYYMQARTLNGASSSGFNIASVPVTLDDGQPHVVGLIRSGVSSARSMFDNVTSAPVPSPADATVTNIYFGSDSFAANTIDGVIAEIVIFDYALSAAERIQMRDYFAAKWGTPTFMPTDVTTTVVWADASDQATITQAAGAVSSWFERSGNLNHIVQATGASQPITNTRTINSKNALDFDGTDDFMEFAAALLTFNNNTTGTMHIVAVDDLNGLGDRNLIAAATTGPNCRVRMQTRTTGPGIRARWSSGTVNSDTTVAVGTATHIWSMEKDAGTLRAYLDGVPLNTAVSGQTTLIDFLLAKDSQFPAQVWDGLIGEVILRTGTDSVADMNLTGNYLANKWGPSWTTVL